MVESLKYQNTQNQKIKTNCEIRSICLCVRICKKSWTKEKIGRESLNHFSERPLFSIGKGVFHTYIVFHCDPKAPNVKQNIHY